MKVRMKTIARGGVLNANPGDEVEVSDKLAADLLNGGYAERVDPEPETATEPPPAETAEAPKRKRARK